MLPDAPGCPDDRVIVQRLDRKSVTGSQQKCQAQLKRHFLYRHCCRLIGWWNTGDWLQSSRTGSSPRIILLYERCTFPACIYNAVLLYQPFHYLTRLPFILIRVVKVFLAWQEEGVACNFASHLRNINVTIKVEHFWFLFMHGPRLDRSLSAGRRLDRPADNTATPPPKTRGPPRRSCCPPLLHQRRSPTKNTISS